ncbi:glycosyl hydrolase family protein [Rhizobium deserti]|uniref:Glycosyl hydrolase family protein n=1 Tax=Rhizobium deserti TaxID=2547961 RepID=A0A4V3APC8_9HYPH|nr:family 1 glycosylhydrolase [Rhizobium deserti]TDK35558.1 glycosyl hydrolase family protein [Rhizobium deserti]
MTARAQPDKLELWGGVECSVVRIRKDWRDQVAETGHLDREEDLDRIAALGIRTLRYPVLWEKVCPSPSKVDFSWHDRRLARMSDLGIRPILGLLHHGSGPSFTGLMDREFPALFAAYAQKVARRCPHVTDFTPINEPLTTARFSGLYGHWYPHRKSMNAFARMMVNQCRAIADAMGAIREVTPGARLIQTEDLGKIFSSPALAYQAEHENQRRWLTFDLLHGLVDRHHPWFEILCRHGIDEAELEAFVDNPCMPDVIGINHYLTSDRFLENRRGAIPPGIGLGGNGRHRYADLEAVRVPMEPDATGPQARLREAWLRYKRPLAATECHHGSTRDEQLRWLHEVWNAAQALRAEGADIRAVTVWALLGLKDWNSLLLLNNQHYEPGAYDIRSPQPRRTAIGRATKEIAETGNFDHPVLKAPGWWRREQRFYVQPSIALPYDQMRSLFILSADGSFAHCLTTIAWHRGLRPVGLPLRMEEPLELLAFKARLEAERPWAVIVNGTGATGTVTGALETALAAACASAKVQFMSISSVQMFTINGAHAWTEAEAPNLETQEALGRRDVEQAIFQANERALLVRTTPVFTDGEQERGWMTSHKGAKTVPDLVSATYAPDLAHAALDLLVDQEWGLWHLASQPPSSAAELAKLLLMDGLSSSPAAKSYSSGSQSGVVALESIRGAIMPSLFDALSRFTPKASGYTIAASTASAEELDGALA